MNRPIPTIPNATKRKSILHHMNHTIILHQRPWRSLCLQPVKRHSISSKVVTGKWLRMLIYPVNNAIYILKINHWQNRPEDLLLHHEGIHPRVQNDGWLHEFLVDIDFASDYQFSAVVFVKEAFHFFGLDLVDHEGHVLRLVVLERFAELSMHGFLECGDEFFTYWFMDKEEVWSDACLASIKKLPPNDLIRSWIQISIFIHNTRALPSKFQNTGSKILCRRLGHIAPDHTTSRKNDHINIRGHG